MKTINYKQQEKVLHHLTEAMIAVSVLEFKTPKFKKSEKLIKKALNQYLKQVAELNV